MLRQVRGLGTLVPEDIRWIPAQSAAQVDKILLRSGAQVHPDSIIMELSDPQLQSDAFTDEALYKQAQADYDALKAKLDSDLMTQKSAAAQVESLYQQAVTTLKYDQQMLEAGIGPQNKVDLDKVSVEQLGIQEKLSQQGLGVAAESDKAQLASAAEKVDSAKGLYELKHSQLDALHVRAGMNGILQCVCSLRAPRTRMCKWANRSFGHKPGARGRSYTPESYGPDSRNAGERRSTQPESRSGYA